MYQKNTELFIKDAIQKHGHKYDYSKVNYISAHDLVIIICPIHGKFKQKPNVHLNGHGCKKCGIVSRISNCRLTTNEFVKKATICHHNKYDYNLVDYVNNKTKIKIKCKLHGLFEQTPSDHLTGYGCPNCGGTKKLTTEEFIKKSNEIHNNKYNYDDVVYKNYITKVKINCPIHGLFLQKPMDHLQKCGCQKCNYDRLIGETNPSWKPDRSNINKLKELHSSSNSYKQKYRKLHNITDSNFHVDHNNPIIAFVEHGIFDLELINSFDNLQILSAENNRRKSGKYNEDQFYTYLKNHNYTDEMIENIKEYKNKGIKNQ